MSTAKMARFCRALAHTTAGSIPILRALELMAGPKSPYYLRRLLPPIIDELHRGGSLISAFRRQQKKFPEEFLELVGAAEKAGALPLAFNRLGDMYEDRLAFIREVTKEMAYALSVVVTAAYVIPFFQGLMMTSLTAEEYAAQFAIRLAFAWIPILLILAVLGHLGLLEKIGTEITARVWPLRKFSLDFAVARFLRSLAMLLEAGLSATQSIERAAATTVHSRLRKKLVQVVPRIQAGEDLASALKASAILPDLAIDMVRTGEYSGRLEELLYKCASYIEDELRHARNLLRIVFAALVLPGIVVAWGLLHLLPAVIAALRSIASLLAGAG
ncbi:MAG TPA: type II secretion system F family protein [Candidatus Hydrogenedentes bacterium]|nr:type II secretion system F family protein [Candidatus Hydrogenedentota bacterium]